MFTTELWSVTSVFPVLQTAVHFSSVSLCVLSKPRRSEMGWFSELIKHLSTDRVSAGINNPVYVDHLWRETSSQSRSGSAASLFVSEPGFVNRTLTVTCWHLCDRSSCCRSEHRWTRVTIRRSSAHKHGQIYCFCCRFVQVWLERLWWLLSALNSIFCRLKNHFGWISVHNKL